MRITGVKSTANPEVTALDTAIRDHDGNPYTEANPLRTQTKIYGADGVYTADVVYEDGLRKLATTKKVQIESLAGVHENASNYISWKEVSVGDTLRIEIDPTPQSPYLDKTFTVQAGEDRFAFAVRIELELNQDFVEFQPWFKATLVDDNSILFIEAKNIGEAGANEAIDSFRVTGTGTIALTVFKGYDNWYMRSSTIQASKSSKDPRLGVFGVEGTVETRSADVTGLFAVQPYANNDPLQVDMDVNGTLNNPVEFTFPMDLLDDIFISEIRFFGLANGIQFTQFLSQNQPLSNGIEIEIKADNSVITLPIIYTTEDFADKFAFGGGDNFSLYIQSGVDKFLASFTSVTFPLRRQGTFGTGNDDYIKVRINDNISQITQLQAAVVGFRQEA